MQKLNSKERISAVWILISNGAKILEDMMLVKPNAAKPLAGKIAFPLRIFCDVKWSPKIVNIWNEKKGKIFWRHNVVRNPLNIFGVILSFMHIFYWKNAYFFQ